MINKDYLLFISESKLAEASKTQYISKLENLCKIVRNNIDWILDNPKATYKIVSDKYAEPQTRKAYLASVLAIFKYGDLKCKRKEEYDKFFEYHGIEHAKIENHYRSGIPSEKQKLAYIPWQDIIAKREELSYGSIDHLLISMYTYIPPLRQDFGQVKFVHKMPEGDAANQGNFIVLTKSRGTLVINDYKTSKSFKEHYVKKLPKELVQIIVKSLTDYPRKYLFVNKKGEVYDRDDSFSRFVNIKLKNMFGKPITVSMLRHSFIIYEHTLKLTPGEIEDSANDMRHSVFTKNRYRFDPKM